MSAFQSSSFTTSQRRSGSRRRKQSPRILAGAQASHEMDWSVINVEDETEGDADDYEGGPVQGNKVGLFLEVHSIGQCV